MKRSWRLIVAAVFLVGGLSYLIGTAVSDSSMYYVTVDEVVDQGLMTSGKSMRMSGDVADGTIDWQAREMRLAFEVTGENGRKLPAVYRGPMPDNFEVGASAILEGQFDESGTFQVDSLMLACPSRFVAEGEELS